MFNEQRTAISLKRAVHLFVAQIVILFIRIGEQIAEISLFLFSIRFGRSRIDEQRGLFVPHETNRRIEEQHFPPFCTTPRISKTSNLFFYVLNHIINAKVTLSPFSQKLDFSKYTCLRQFLWWRGSSRLVYWPVRYSRWSDFTTKS